MFESSRLVVARKRRGLTKVELGARASLTPETIWSFERARSQPSDEAVDAIATATQFPIPFFHRGPIEEPSPEGVSFRSLKSMTAGQRNAALAAGALAFELSDWISAHFELPSAALPDLRDYRPEDAALALRTRWGIGERPIGNMIHLLESFGIRVFSLAERATQVDAYSLWLKGVPFVFLNTMKTAEHGRMDAAHELGHLVLHRHGVPRSRDAEKEAQAFGASFLMPEASVRGVVPRLNAPSLQTLAQLKLKWRVSLAALAHRLYTLGLISEWSYRVVFIELSKRGRANEPYGIEHETSQVLAKVFGSLRESGMTKADVARQLGLYTDDLDALIFGLSITPASEGRRVPDASAAKRRGQLRLQTKH
jgi:Zn-dependent peptidase ImmA (M78 family)/DNA-binding XRE family transcriptional regulator